MPDLVHIDRAIPFDLVSSDSGKVHGGTQQHSIKSIQKPPYVPQIL